MVDRIGIAERRQLRVGLVGCGEHASENLIPSLAEIATVKVVAVTDPDPLAAAAAAAKLSGARIESAIGPLLQRTDIEALVVAATPQTHALVAREAFARDLHVFVEKPPTVSRQELETLAAQASERGLVTCVGHNLRHSAVAEEMHRFLESMDRRQGRAPFGRPVAMEMRYCASKPRGDRWGLGSPLRSFLLSHANHAIDFMVYQMGPITRVNAAIASLQEPGIALAAQFVFAGGAVGTLLATSLAPHFTIGGSVVSDEGKVLLLESLHELTLYGIDGDPKRWGRKWTTKSLLTGYDAAGYKRELEAFVDAVRYADPTRCQPSFAEEIAVYEALDTIEQLILDPASL